MRKKKLCVFVEGNDFITIVDGVTRELKDYIGSRKWNCTVPHVVDRQGNESLSIGGWDLGLEVDIEVLYNSGRGSLPMSDVVDIIDIVSFSQKFCKLRHTNLLLFVVDETGRKISYTKSVNKKKFERDSLESLVESLTE